MTLGKPLAELFVRENHSGTTYANDHPVCDTLVVISLVGLQMSMMCSITVQTCLCKASSEHGGRGQKS